MTIAKNHPAGSFCWIELATTDQEGARKFYSSLFGWSPNDNPMGPGEVYTIFRLDGRDAGAGYTMRKEQRDQHIPPNWALYIAADNADDVVSKATKAGGKVLMPAFDVMELGRMAVLQDPTGAVFCTWQAKTHGGIGTASGDNALCWADLITPDAHRAEQFYSSVFGWKLEKSPNDPSGYLHIKNGDHYIGGIPPAEAGDPRLPPHWIIYFQVADVEASTKKVQQLGGRVYMPPRKMEGVGTWSVVADPQGAAFALFKSAR